MNWSISFFLNSMLLGVGLTMDAFSVSLVNGLNEPKMRKRKQAAIAGTFAAFQAIMPLIGWLCVHTIVQYFRASERFIPWIALLLLLYIGGKMVYEGWKPEEKKIDNMRLRPSTLLIQGIATSIDALSVGFTIAEYGFAMALVCALIISGVTFIICICGLLIGRKIGTRLSGKASIVGGLILIGIGIEIFVTRVL